MVRRRLPRTPGIDMTAAPTSELSPYPETYMTPECSVGRTDPDFRHGCPACPAPGYQHPVLGWTPWPCACTCHAEKEAQGC
jgi:hypothetical protein